MPIALKPLEKYAENYKTYTPLKIDAYRFGIANPRRPWKAGAKAGKDNFKNTMSKVLAEDRQTKGVDKASESDWTDPALALGADNWSRGVVYNAEKWGKKYAPFYAHLRGLTLTPRGIVDSEANYARSKEVGKALHRKKLEVLGAAA